MNVKICGFYLQINQAITMEDLFNYAKNWKNPFGFQQQDRILKIKEDKKYFLGSIISDRGHKSFLALDTASNQTVSGRLPSGQHFSAFNFFIISKSTNACLMTSYREVGGASLVFGILKRITDELVQKNVSEGKMPKPGKKKVDNLRWIQILGNEEYLSIIEKWKRIKAIEFEYEVAKSPVGFIPKSKELNMVKVRATFTKGTTISEAVVRVKSFLTGGKIGETEKVKIDGTDENSLSKIVEVDEKVPSLFGVHDFDSIVENESNFSEDLLNAKIIKEMVLVANNSSHFRK